MPPDLPPDLHALVLQSNPSTFHDLPHEQEHVSSEHSFRIENHSPKYSYTKSGNHMNDYEPTGMINGIVVDATLVKDSYICFSLQ